jgi:hypothetical protein
MIDRLGLFFLLLFISLLTNKNHSLSGKGVISRKRKKRRKKKRK